MGCCRRARSHRGRDLLLLSENHRRVLPALVRGAPCESRERAIPSDGRRCRARRVPALQAVQAGPAAAREAACRNHRRSLPGDRSRGVDAAPGVAGRGAPGSALTISIAIFKAVTGLTPREYAAAHRARRVRARAEAAVDRDGSHLRRGVQFRRPLLRDVRRDAGHDAERLPRGRLAHRHSICRRRVLPRFHPGRPEREGCLRDPARATIRTLSCAICRIAFLARR